MIVCPGHYVVQGAISITDSIELEGEWVVAGPGCAQARWASEMGTPRPCGMELQEGMRCQPLDFTHEGPTWCLSSGGCSLWHPVLEDTQRKKRPQALARVLSG